MNNICVYTCITGNYDNLKEIKKEKGIDYYCFTNNKNITSNSWKIIYIEDENLNNVKLARKTKILGHKEIEKYEIKLWMDAAVSFKKKIKDFIDFYLEKKDNFVAFKHGCRDNIKDEAYECVKLDKEKKEKVIKLLDFYKKENYPDDGLIESTVFIKRKNKKVDETMKLWFEMIEKYSHRDQLSFNYCIYKTNLKVKWINEKVFDNEWFDWIKHNTQRKIEKYRLYFGNEEKFNLKNDIQGNYIIDNDKYIIEQTIPKTTDTLLIGPCHVRDTILKEIKLNGKIIIKYEKRGIYKYEKYELFADENPFIILKGNFIKGKKIKIELKMEVLDIEKVGIILEKILREKQEDEIKHNKEINLKDEENRKLNEKLQAIYSGRYWKLKQKIEKITKKR